MYSNTDARKNLLSLAASSVAASNVTLLLLPAPASSTPRDCGTLNGPCAAAVMALQLPDPDSTPTDCASERHSDWAIASE